MNSKDLEKALLMHNKGKYLISLHSLREFLGLGQNATADLLRGLECIKQNGSTKFFIPDVAKKIIGEAEIF